MITLTQIELTVWAAAFGARCNEGAAAYAVCRLGRLKWPTYEGDAPAEGQVILNPSYSAYVAQAHVLTVAILEAAQRQNAAQFADMQEGA
jgi:hypothetical protein